jgi:murein DD-endopeptidase MepM/ murein hydrolase activator NlpD
VVRLAVLGPFTALAVFGVASVVAADSGGPAPAVAIAAQGPGAPRAAVSYRAPVPVLEVERGFDPPTTAYGAGHLGVDLRAAPGSVIRSAADGVVSFAGPVAGRGVVVVAHADGVRTEYEPLRVSTASGMSVRRGQPIGVVAGTHRGCTDSCLHWGARRGAIYLDPLTLLRRLAPVRLLPWPTGRSP